MKTIETFMDDMRADERFAQEIYAKADDGLHGIVAFASERGYAFSEEELRGQITSQTGEIPDEVLTKISGGSQSKESGKSAKTNGKKKNKCYITTATAEQFGWDDDCRVLTVMRDFRDNVMEKNAEWSGDIETYYAVAPHIVRALEDDPKAYRDLWEKWLRPGVSAAASGNNDRAYKIYRGMVEHLAKEHLR